MSDNSKKFLISLVERIERLSEEKDVLADDIREVYEEAKGLGFSTKILRKGIAVRKMDPSEREEIQTMMEMYMAALDEGD